MSKKHPPTVAIHVRLYKADVEEIDRIADAELISRSQLVARIVREWIDKQSRRKRKN